MLWEVSSTESSWGLKNKPVSKVARGLGENKNKAQAGRYSEDSDRADYTKVLVQHTAKQVSSWWGAWTSSKGKPNSACYTWQKLEKKTPVCHACEKFREGDSIQPPRVRKVQRRPQPAICGRAREEDLKSPSMKRVEKETPTRQTGKRPEKKTPAYHAWQRPEKETPACHA